MNYEDVRKALLALDPRGPETVEEYIRLIWELLAPVSGGEWSCRLDYGGGGEG